MTGISSDTLREHQCTHAMAIAHGPATHSATTPTAQLVLEGSFGRSVGNTTTNTVLCIRRLDKQPSLGQTAHSSVTRIHEQTHGLAFHTLLDDVVHENRVCKLLQMASVIWHSSLHGYG